MLRSPLVWLKLLLWIVAAMHLIVGAGFNLVPGFAQYMSDVYGAEVNWTSEFRYILRPLGAFMVTLGLLAIPAAWAPRRHRVIIYGFVFLFLARALQRIAWAQDVQTAFGISSERNVANMVFFTLIALSLLVLDLVVCRRATREPPG